MRKVFSIGIVIIAAVSMIVGWALITPYFAIRRVEFFGLRSIKEDEIRLPFDYGDNLLLMSASLVEERIGEDRRIERVEVRKRLPDGVEIFVVEKSPCYLLNCGELWGLTRNGEAIPMSDPRKIPNLPIITSVQMYQPIPYRKVNEPSVLRALKFANKIADENPSFLDEVSEFISRREGEYSLFLANTGIEVSLSDAGENSLEKLSVIMRELGEQKKDVVQIDLRFPEQGIVRFRKGSCAEEQSGGRS